MRAWILFLSLWLPLEGSAASWQRYTCVGQLSTFKLNSFSGNLADGRTPEEEFTLSLHDQKVVIEGTTSFDDEYPKIASAPEAPIRFQLDSGRRCKSGIFNLDGLEIYLERSAHPGCSETVGSGGDYTLHGHCRLRDKTS